MINTILKQVKEFRLPSILAPLCMVGEVCCELMLPFLMSYIIDKGVYMQDMTSVLKYGGIMLVCAFASLFFGTASGNFAAKASCGLAKNLRSAMFSKIQDFSFRNTDKYSTSGLVTRMMTDVTNTQNAFQMLLRMCVRAPLTLIVSLIMTVTISARLSTVFMWAILFLAICLTIMISKATPVFTEVFAKYDDLNASVQENITNMRVVKAYVREAEETEKFKGASWNVYKLFIKAENILVFNSPIMQLTVYSCIIALSWFGAHYIVAGTLTTGGLMSMFSYTMNILMSLMMLSMIFVMMSMSVASMRRISDLLNEKIDLVNPEKPITEVTDGSIEFKNVFFKYYVDAKEFNLSDINLSIRSGETIGILGGTGSAKSTMVQLIPRLYDVDSGSVSVGGVDVRKYYLESLRSSVAMVLQKNVLFSGTIKENMRWGNPNATDEQIVSACRLAQADEFVRQFPDGYDTYIEQGGTNVSGGQKQRLCIARAILKNPKVLILDDSTSAVDTRTDMLIRKAFREDIPDTTKIIISQRISSVEDADRIVVLDDGKIDAVGTHSELLKSNAIYQDVYETQKKGEDDE